jgi:hypothetical protein
MPTDLIKWFDPTNPDHMRAYLNLYSPGWWPKGFLPEDIEFPNHWNIRLMNKIVETYIKQMLPGELEKVLKR